MDMSLREWLILLGVIIIAAVVIDGLRRARRARLDSVEMANGIGQEEYDSPVEEDFNPELPSRTFRVIRKGEDSASLEGDGYGNHGYSNDRNDRYASEDFEDDGYGSDDYRKDGYAKEGYSKEDNLSDGISATFPDEPGAGHNHSVEQAGQSGTAQPGRPAGSSGALANNGMESFSALDDDASPTRADMPMTATEEDETSGQSQSLQADSRAQEYDQRSSSKLSAKDDFKDRFLKKITSAKVEKKPVKSAAKATTKATVASQQTSSQSSGQNGREQQKEASGGVDFDEVIVVNVLAKGGEEFNGAELQDLAEACGMQLGEMSIYHRHEYDLGKGPVQFSMANVLPPGTFKEKIEKTPGVCFFVKLPGPDESMQAFDYMIETAQCVVRNLGGELKDEQHSVMTPQTIEHCRQRVREFERRQLSPK